MKFLINGRTKRFPVYVLRVESFFDQAELEGAPVIVVLTETRQGNVVAEGELNITKLEANHGNHRVAQAVINAGQQ